MGVVAKLFIFPVGKMASLFKRRSTAVSSDLKHLTESETALAQSSFNVEKITEIQNRFAGGETLLVPGRIFIREGMLWKSCRKGLKKRQFFLFNDVLVYGSIVARGRYSNQHVLPLNVMTVESECHYQPSLNEDVSLGQGELESENAFQVNHTNKSFHVVAQSKADRANWLSNLQKQIKKVTESGNGGGQAVFKAVWVPDSACKECLLCKQKFTAFVRKHHCRMCGRVVCSSCSPHKADIMRLLGAEASGKLDRVCSTCFKSTSPASSSGQVNQSGSVGDSLCLPCTVATEDSAADRPELSQQSDSSQTSDSDDSEVESPPVPPPRRKKQLRQQQQQQQQQVVVLITQQLTTEEVDDKVTSQQGADPTEQVEINNVEEESQVKPVPAIRRRQKYRSPEEEPGAETRIENVLGSGEEAECDPLARSSRSPSAHVRLRKSKFTTKSTASDDASTD